MTEEKVDDTAAMLEGNGPEPGLAQKVKAILAREWGLTAGEIPDDAALNKFPAWDSLGHIRILLALEAKCGLLLDVDTVQELISLERILEHLGEGRVPVPEESLR